MTTSSSQGYLRKGKRPSFKNQSKRGVLYLKKRMLDAIVVDVNFVTPARSIHKAVHMGLERTLGALGACNST